jgi:CVNH domain
MTHLSRNLSTLAASVLWLGISGLLSSPAHAQSPSTYPSSCHHIGMSGATLVAVCRRVDGSFNQTSIVLQGIENIDGQLQFTQPSQPASFQDSCRDIHVIGSTLNAICRRADGSYERTSMEVPGIANVDGNLQYGP